MFTLLIVLCGCTKKEEILLLSGEHAAGTSDGQSVIREDAGGHTAPETETGRTAKDFISDKVLAFACELLSDMSLSVSQVAMKLGFDYPQHFNRFFKRHTGKTPKGFRLSAAG